MWKVTNSMCNFIFPVGSLPTYVRFRTYKTWICLLAQVSRISKFVRKQTQLFLISCSHLAPSLSLLFWTVLSKDEFILSASSASTKIHLLLLVPLMLYSPGSPLSKATSGLSLVKVKRTFLLFARSAISVELPQILGHGFLCALFPYFFFFSASGNSYWFIFPSFHLISLFTWLIQYFGSSQPPLALWCIPKQNVLCSSLRQWNWLVFKICMCNTCLYMMSYISLGNAVPFFTATTWISVVVS